MRTWIYSHDVIATASLEYYRNDWTNCHFSWYSHLRWICTIL